MGDAAAAADPVADGGMDPQASPARTRMRAPPRSTEESIAAGCW